jgi:hypothetical protein
MKPARHLSVDFPTNILTIPAKEWDACFIFLLDLYPGIVRLELLENIYRYYHASGPAGLTMS